METPIGRTKIDIYELSEDLYDTLIVAANGDSPTFALLEPREDEEPERRKRLNREMAEIEDLIQMDLLKDVSDNWAPQIAVCKIQYGFSYRVVTMTEMAMMMFTKGRKEPIN